MSYIKRMMEDAYYELKDGVSTKEVKEKYHLTNEDIYNIITIMSDNDEEQV